MSLHKKVRPTTQSGLTKTQGNDSRKNGDYPPKSARPGFPLNEPNAYGGTLGCDAFF